MVAASEYSVHTQAKIIHALCVLHNFIRVHDPDDISDIVLEEIERVPQATAAADFGGAIRPQETKRAGAHRDQIAKEMWADYSAYISQM